MKTVHIEEKKEWGCRLPFSLSDWEILVSSTTCGASSVPSIIPEQWYQLLPEPFHCSRQPSRLIPQLKKRFLEFCLRYRPPFGIKFMPVDENTLVQYATYLARSIKYSSIKSYPAAVRHLHILNGYDLDFKKYPRLQLICKGIKRAQGCSTRVRLPTTI